MFDPGVREQLRSSGIQVETRVVREIEPGARRPADRRDP